MARKKVNKSAKNKNTGSKQGHKLVVFTAVLILIPCVIIGLVLLTSIGGQNKPVVGERFSKHDLQPAIEKSHLNQLEKDLAIIDGLEEVEVNLKSATLRIQLNLVDDANEDQAKAAVEKGFEIVTQLLPIDQYFTNTDTAKMYDLEIDGFNFIPAEGQSQEGFAYVKLTKTGASANVIDVMSSPKDAELAQQVRK